MGASRSEAEAVLGSLASCFLFRRELFSACGLVYGFVRRLPVRRRVKFGPAIADEVVCASLLQLAAQASLRWPLLPAIVATDASLAAGGATWAHVPPAVAEHLYNLG